MSDPLSNLPDNPDPRPATGSGVTPISSQSTDQRSVAETYASKSAPIGIEGGNPFSQFSSPPPLPSFPSDTPTQLSYQEVKPMVAKALNEIAEEGNLPTSFFSQPPQPQPDFRFGVQLSTPIQSPVQSPIQSPVQHVEHGQLFSGEKPKDQPIESVSQFSFRQDVERETTNSFSQSLGTSTSAPMSKEDTIKELADKINHDSGGKMGIAESRAEATKQYEKKEAEVTHGMQASAPKGTTIYGTDPGEIAKNLGDIQRKQGETGKQYEERQHRMREIKSMIDPARRKEALGKYVSEQLGDGYLPVLFRRADGQHGTLAYVLSGVNIANDDSATVKGSNGDPKDLGSYYSVIPPFFGYSADQNKIYTAWFGKSEDGLIETSSIYQFSVNGDNDEQIKLNVTPSSGGDPPQITVFDGSNTGKYGPVELYLDNANQGASVTLTADDTPELILFDGANTFKTSATEIYIDNANEGTTVTLTSESTPELILFDGANTGKYGPVELYLDNANGGSSVTLTADGTPELILFDGTVSVKLDIPDNNGTKLEAYWQEIDVCVEGAAMKMQVFGTDPY